MTDVDASADSRDEQWMRLALEQARQAAAAGEVPVGAVLVRGEELLAAGHNAPITSHDPTAHAEIVTLRRAAAAAGNYRLPQTTLYVTIEPCTMCIGALMHARVERVVFGAREPRAGAVCSAQQLASATYFNHRMTTTEGVLADECSSLLTRFFRARRQAQPAIKAAAAPESPAPGGLDTDSSPAATGADFLGEAPQDAR